MADGGKVQQPKFFGASYIPPNQFDLYRWLRPSRPVHAPEWYYWLLRESPHPGSWVDISTVDLLLRPLVKLAQTKGIKAFPSCQGHFHLVEDLREQETWLKKEVRALRKGELELTDVETGIQYQPYLPTWSIDQNISRNMLRYNGCGRLAFLFDKRDKALDFGINLGAIQSCSSKVEGVKVDISVCVVAPEELEWTWREVGAVLQDSVR